MIRIVCHHTLAEAAAMREAMDALNLASERPDPFSSFAFYEHYLAHASPGDRSQPWLLLALEDDVLVGYAALKRSVHRVLGFSAAKVDWLTAPGTDRPHLVARAEHRTAVAAALYAWLLERRRDWSLLEFQQQDATSPLAPPPEAARHCRVREWPTLENGTIVMRWPSIAAYFAELPKKARSNVSRQMRRLLAAGDVQVLSSSDPASLEPLFSLYRSVEARSWKAEPDAADPVHDARWAEHSGGLMHPGQPMRIAIHVLLLDGLPVAGLITGAFARGLHALQIVHDEHLAHLGPGSAILLMGVRSAIAGGYDYFNLLRGFGYYKARWLAQLTETRSVQVYRAGSPFHWQRLLGDARRRWSRAPEPRRKPGFNPAHRAFQHRVAPDGPAVAAPAPLDAHHSAWVASAQRGRGEFLSAAELAAALPFPTR